MNNLATALLGLLQSMRSAHYQNGAPRGRGNEQTIRHKSGKTRRGATHVRGSVFKGRKIFKVTPAEYRRNHIAVLSRKTPNYRLPHAKPQWRNRWTSA